MKKIFLLSAAFFCLFAFSCKKENSEPQDKCLDRPHCEDCDWNVLTYKLNGIEKCTKSCTGDGLFGCDPVDCLFYPETTSFLSIGGANLQIVNYSTHIGVNYPEYHSRLYFNPLNDDSCKRYSTDTLANNWINIYDIDTSKKVIEGSFEFTAINACQDTVRITDGYFKLTYRP